MLRRHTESSAVAKTRLRVQKILSSFICSASTIGTACVQIAWNLQLKSPERLRMSVWRNSQSYFKCFCRSYSRIETRVHSCTCVHETGGGIVVDQYFWPTDSVRIFLHHRRTLMSHQIFCTMDYDILFYSSFFFVKACLVALENLCLPDNSH